MTKFEVGKVYGTKWIARIRIESVNGYATFWYQEEDEVGNFVNNTYCEKAARLKIRKGGNDNEYVELDRGRYISSNDLIDEDQYIIDKAEAKAAREEAKRLEAERIANAPEMKFGQSIDFAELFNYIEQFVGSKLSFTKPEVERRRYDWRIHWHSGEVDPGSIGIFGKILKSCVVAPFGNAIVKDEDGSFRYWVSVHVHYEHKAGGSNGMELFTARYENGKWSFN